MTMQNIRKKFRRYFAHRVFGFNMVEVALAMLVISLGLSTVLVLFPAGMKASRQAEEENLLVEAAEAMEAHIRNHHTANNFPNVLTHNSDAGTNLQENNFSGNRNITINDNTFLYRKLTRINGSDETEFSCIVRLLADPTYGIGHTADSGNTTIAYFPAASSPDATITYSDDFGSSSLDLRRIVATSNSNGIVTLTNGNASEYFKVINMEISYPANKPYSARKKRVYRLEIFY